jgi:hypothetical protein
VIQDLDGATTEPSRRWHVTVLSAAVAAVSLVLLLVLIAPPTPVGAPPVAASPLPDQRASGETTFLSNPRRSLPVELTRSTTCPDAAVWAPYPLAVDPGSEPLFLALYDRTGRSPIAFVQQERGTGRFVLTCATPDSVVPRLNRAR